jgi:hypothetical protein
MSVRETRDDDIDRWANHAGDQSTVPALAHLARTSLSSMSEGERRFLGGRTITTVRWWHSKLLRGAAILAAIVALGVF